MARAKRRGGTPTGGGARRPIPPWLWTVTGLTAGLFIAFLVYLGTQERPREPARPAASAKPKERPAATATAAKPAPTATAPQDPRPAEKPPVDYDFYDKLPKFRVQVPEAQGGTRPRPAAQVAYLLQAGSFRSPGEAEARKAQLALLGIVSTIQVVHVDGKQAYHRVRTETYRDPALLDRARATLRENHIDFVALPDGS